MIWSHLSKKILMENFIFCSVRREMKSKSNISSFPKFLKADLPSLKKYVPSCSLEIKIN